ncbi:hypothetical protein BH683_012560 [Williamsia sp. 1138]|nr:hypothetical protein BH683_012560 [Williamsia sp. 1138]
MPHPGRRRLYTALRTLRPVGAPGLSVEVVRASVGASVGLGLTGLTFFVLNAHVDAALYLVAPFGATAVLLFAAPSSPLAQPWPVVVGNTSAALVGITVTPLMASSIARVCVAVAVTVAVMLTLRAVHPPAGAVAMTVALAPEAGHSFGFLFAFVPVAAGTLLLVIVAAVYGRITRHRYPLRQFESAPAAVERIGLTESELHDILARYEQSLNLGVADLARLVGAAEIQAAGHRTEPIVAGDIMSTDLVTVRPTASVNELVDLFHRHEFTCLPVVHPADRLAGVVFQIHLLVRLRESSIKGRLDTLFRRGNARERSAVCAADIMDVGSPTASVRTPVAALLPLLAASDCDAVPILDDDIIVGIVTQTDLIAALARHTVSESQVSITESFQDARQAHCLR